MEVHFTLTAVVRQGPLEQKGRPNQKIAFEADT